MQIHVARAGKELGVFPAEEVRNRLASGEFQPTDHGWAEGQGDWKLLMAFPILASVKPIPPPPEPVPNAPLPREPKSKNSARHKSELVKSPILEPEFGLPVRSLPEPRITPELDLEPALPQPKPRAELEPEPGGSVVPEPEPEPELQPVASAVSEPEPEPEPEAEMEVEMEMEPEPVTDAVADPESVPSVSSRRRSTATTAVPLSSPPRPFPMSGEAIASFVLGILSISVLPVLTPLPAVILGHLAKRRIERSRGTLRGAGMAQAGLITGYIGAGLAVIAVLAAIVLAVAGMVQAKNAQTKALDNGRAIAVACRMYAADHQGAFPKKLEALVPDYLPDGSVFICPYSGPSEPVGYIYYGGRVSDPETKILLVSKGRSKGKRRVLVDVGGTAALVKDRPELAPHDQAP
jgi:type II secretory pathway pseudopilin PulG